MSTPTHVQNKPATNEAGVPPAPPEDSSNRQHFDVLLEDVREGRWVFAEPAMALPAPPNAAEWACGWARKRGVATRSAEGWWRFQAYHDQSLRRMPELDDVARDLIGWWCESKPKGFVAPGHIVPGIDGGFVADQTAELTVQVPPEFETLCESYGMDASAVLRGFMADAAGLMNWVSCPRADGFSSNGSDERMMAQDYLERAYGCSQF